MSDDLERYDIDNDQRNRLGDASNRSCSGREQFEHVSAVVDGGGQVHKQLKNSIDIFKGSEQENGQLYYVGDLLERGSQGGEQLEILRDTAYGNCRESEQSDFIGEVTRRDYQVSEQLKQHRLNNDVVDKYSPVNEQAIKSDEDTAVSFDCPAGTMEIVKHDADTVVSSYLDAGRIELGSKDCRKQGSSEIKNVLNDVKHADRHFSCNTDEPLSKLDDYSETGVVKCDDSERDRLHRTAECNLVFEGSRETGQYDGTHFNQLSATAQLSRNDTHPIAFNSQSVSTRPVLCGDNVVSVTERYEGLPAEGRTQLWSNTNLVSSGLRLKSGSHIDGQQSVDEDIISTSDSRFQPSRVTKVDDIWPGDNKYVNFDRYFVRSCSSDSTPADGNSNVQTDLFRTSSETELSQMKPSSQPGVFNLSSMSKSDQDLLGSDSVLFDDLLPTFRELPFFLNVDSTDVDAFGLEIIGNEFAHYENLLPQYRELPPEMNSSVSYNRDAPLRADMRDVFTETGNGARNDFTGTRDSNTAILDFSGSSDSSITINQLEEPPNKSSEHLQAKQRERYSNGCYDAKDYDIRRFVEKDESDIEENGGGDSMDSITYVFVGKGASSLERFDADDSDICGENHMLRSSSEPHSRQYVRGRRSRRRPNVEGYDSPQLTRSQSVRCRSSLPLESPARTSLSLTYLDFIDICDEDIPIEHIFGQLTSASRHYHKSNVGTDGEYVRYKQFEWHNVGPDVTNEVELHFKSPSIVTNTLVLKGSNPKTAQTAVESEKKLVMVKKHKDYRHSLSAAQNDDDISASAQRSVGKASRNTSACKDAQNVNPTNVLSNLDVCHPTKTVSITVVSKDVSTRQAIPEMCSSNKGSSRGRPESMDSAGGRLESTVSSSEHHFGSRERAVLPLLENQPQVVEKWQSMSPLPAKYQPMTLSRRAVSSCGHLGFHNPWSVGDFDTGRGSRTIETQTYPQVRVIETQTPLRHRALATQTVSSQQENNLLARANDLMVDSAVGTSPPSTPITTRSWSGSSVMPAPNNLTQSTTGYVSGVDQTGSYALGSAADSSAATTKLSNRDGYFPSPFDGDLVDAEHREGVDAVHNQGFGGLNWPRFDGVGSGRLVDDFALQRKSQTDASETIDGRFRQSRELMSNAVDGLVNQRKVNQSNDRCITMFSDRSDGKDQQKVEAKQSGLCRTNNGADTRGMIFSSESSDEDDSKPAYQLLDDDSASETNEDGKTKPEDDLNLHLTWNTQAQTERILAKYRTKRNRATRNCTNETPVTLQTYSLMQSPPNMIGVQTNSLATPAYSPLPERSPADQANVSSATQDSGVADNGPSVSANRSNTSFMSDCRRSDKSTDTCVDAAADRWDDELERLRRERQRIVDMLARDVIPSRIQVEMAEAQLNYLIGQTDLLLQTIDEPVDWERRQWRRPDNTESLVEGAEFLARYRQRLVDSQLLIDAEIAQLEQASKGNASQRIPQSDDVLSPRNKTHWTAMERERYLLDLRRNVVSVTANSPNAGSEPVSSPQSRLDIQRPRLKRRRLSFGRSVTSRRLHQSSPNVSITSSWPLSVGTESICEEPLANDFATTSPSLSAAECRRVGPVGSTTSLRAVYAGSMTSLNDEMSRLLTECQDARERARVEIDYAMEALRRTSPAWSYSSSFNRPFSTSSPRSMTHATSVNDLDSTLTGNYELYDDLDRLPSTSRWPPQSGSGGRWRFLAEDRIRRNSTGTFSSSGQSPRTQSSPVQRSDNDRTASELSATAARSPALVASQSDFRYQSHGSPMASLSRSFRTNGKQPTVTLKTTSHKSDVTGGGAGK